MDFKTTVKHKPEDTSGHFMKEHLQQRTKSAYLPKALVTMDHKLPRHVVEAHKVSFLTKRMRSLNKLAASSQMY